MRYYTTQEIADEIGVHVSSVYSWEKKGLLVPAKKTPTGRRFYSEAQMDAIRNNDFENSILKGYGEDIDIYG